MDKLAESVARALAVLVDRLGVTSTHLFAAYARSAYYSGLLQVIMCGLLFVVLLTISMYLLIKTKDANLNRREDHIGGAVIIGLIAAMFLSFTFMGVHQMLCPEPYALEGITKALGGVIGK